MGRKDGNGDETSILSIIHHSGCGTQHWFYTLNGEKCRFPAKRRWELGINCTKCPSKILLVEDIALLGLLRKSAVRSLTRYGGAYLRVKGQPR